MITQIYNKGLVVLFILTVTLQFNSIEVKGQTTYYDASAFPILGKAIPNETETRYERLPSSLKGKIREPLWNLGKNSAGLAIRFRSNTTSISIKWELPVYQSLNHMTVTGINGLDLYCLENGKWLFVGSARPQQKTDNTATVISNMIKTDREYLLYLPLYNAISTIFIGIDSQSELSQPQIQSPVRDKPLVFYGTSILQGGCASRPGMAHTNILSRWLNREIVNLGFSGNGQLDLEIAEVISKVDASVFILDFVPNATVEQMTERTKRFYRIIRDKHPQTPIVFIEDPEFTHIHFDQKIAHEVKSKNETINKIFNALKESGERNIYLISSKGMIGNDGEATVDGIHFTDLGFMRYAEFLYPTIDRLLNK
jgi:lysophospholipase L1-like esterase